MDSTATVRTAHLSGDTYEIRDVLKREGWDWDATTKTWTYRAEWADEAEVIDYVRDSLGYRSIRQTGKFVVRFDLPTSPVRFGRCRSCGAPGTLDARGNGHSCGCASE